MFKGVFEKLFWTNVLILVIVFVVVSGSMSVFINNYINDRQYSKITKISEAIDYWTGYLQIEHDNVRSRKFYKETLKDWAEFLEADITVADLDGNVIDTTNNAVAHVPDEYIQKIRNGVEIRENSNFGNSYENKVLTVGIPIEYYGNRIGGMYVNTPMPNLVKMAWDILILFFVSAMVIIVAAFALIYRQAVKVSASISRINSAVLDIAAGNFDERLAVSGQDELSQLASSFNFMASSLGKLDNMRNRFISDISHELRTPMTSISGFIEGILDGTIPPEKQDDYLKIVLDESTRLKKLVTDMLEMSRMSSNEYKLNASEFDFTELIRICIIGLEQKISEKSLDLNVDFQAEKMMVFADRDAIQRVLINLMDNAVKFSYPNTVIDVKMWFDSKKAYFSVGNYGSGIEKKNLPHVFDRFYKTDESRTNKTSGAGLGLSFVKNIMVLHKQSIWVDSTEAKEGSNVKYTKFTFSLEKA